MLLFNNFQVTQIASGYGFTVAAIKTNEQHKVFGTGINTDSQIGYHSPRIGHPLEILLSPAPIYVPYKSLESKVNIVFKEYHILFSFDDFYDCDIDLL